MRNLVVVGSGIAGLFTALSAYRRGVRDVLIVTKASLEESATRYAALRRAESRGAHQRTDFPEPRREWRRRQAFVVRTRRLLETHAIGEARRAGMEVLS